MIWMVIECYKYGMEQIEKTSGAQKKKTLLSIPSLKLT